MITLLYKKKIENRKLAEVKPIMPLASFLNKAMILALLAVFIMLVVGGFRYLTAAGDPKANEAAKNTITYALLGLVLMFGAWFILRFIGVFTGLNLTEFTLEFPK